LCRVIVPTQTNSIQSTHPRLCISDGLDPDQPPIGIPSFVALCPDNFGRSLFFVRIEEDATSAVVRMLRQPPAPGAGAASKGANGGGGAAGAALTKAALGVAARGDSAGWLPPIAVGEQGFADRLAGGAGYGLVGCSLDASSESPDSPSLSSSLLWMARSCSNGGGVTGSVTDSVTGNSGPVTGPVTSSAASGSPVGSFSSRQLPQLSGPNGFASASASRGCIALGSGCPVAGLLLGPLLGRGSYGRVHRGIFKGQPVAVKVRCCCVCLIESEESAGATVAAASGYSPPLNPQPSTHPHPTPHPPDHQPGQPYRARPLGRAPGVRPHPRPRPPQPHAHRGLRLWRRRVGAGRGAQGARGRRGAAGVLDGI
jgi:hypothetical protein